MEQGAVFVTRDERNRVVGLTLKGVSQSTFATRTALHFLQAAVTSLREYLHVEPEFVVGTEATLVVNRDDPHLNREIDAVMETLLIGVKTVATEYPEEFEVYEAPAEIKA